MILPGEYSWRKNNRYGSNHRVLTLTGPGGEGAAIHRFTFLVIHSAGFQGKAGSVTTGTVRAAGPDRLELVAETIEHFTHDDDMTSQTFPCEKRMLFVAEKTWWGWRTAYLLDGEPFAALPPRG